MVENSEKSGFKAGIRALDDPFSSPDQHKDGHGQARESLNPSSAITSQESRGLGGLRRRSPSPAPSSVEIPIADDELLNHGVRTGISPQEALLSSPPSTAWTRFWERNTGSVLVAVSQLFAAIMNVCARLLELEGKGMHPVQVLLMRQSLTAFFCIIYMWRVKTPEFPFGPKRYRGLLFIRGFSGFFGIFGVWYSMMYIGLADATVIGFLSPGVAGIICYFTLKEPFTKVERYATLLALLGVALIAQPTALFAQPAHGPASGSAGPAEPEGHLGPGLDHETTSSERLAAVGVAMVGVFGAAGAFSCLRAIGKAAHPLISVNYFSVLSTIMSATILLVAPVLDINQPFLSWTTPQTLRQCGLMVSLGTIGFVMQYVLTMGLQMDRSNRANSMIYTNMLWAAGFDKWIFNHDMTLMSFAGCALIVGSAVGVMLTKKPKSKKGDDVERLANSLGETEASQMLVGAGDGPDDISLERLR